MFLRLAGRSSYEEQIDYDSGLQGTVFQDTG